MFSPCYLFGPVSYHSPLACLATLTYLLLLKHKPTAAQGHCTYLHCFKCTSLLRTTRLLPSFQLGLSLNIAVSEVFLDTLPKIAYPSFTLCSLALPYFSSLCLLLSDILYICLFTVYLILPPSPPHPTPTHTRM